MSPCPLFPTLPQPTPRPRLSPRLTPRENLDLRRRLRFLDLCLTAQSKLAEEIDATNDDEVRGSGLPGLWGWGV